MIEKYLENNWQSESGGCGEWLHNSYYRIHCDYENEDNPFVLMYSIRILGTFPSIKLAKEFVANHIIEKDWHD